MQPDAIEISLSEIESAASKVLCDIEKNKKIPGDLEDRRTLFYFVAMQAVRIPLQRNNVNSMLQELFRMMSLQVVSHQYEKIRKQIVEAEPDSADLTKEELIRLMANPESVGINVAPELGLLLMKDMADGIYEILLQRTWSVAVVTLNKSNRFVTSDNPVLLYFNQKPPPELSPGFGLSHTVVFFAVSPTIAIW